MTTLNKLTRSLRYKTCVNKTLAIVADLESDKENRLSLHSLTKKSAKTLQLIPVKGGAIDRVTQHNLKTVFEFEETEN